MTAFHGIALGWMHDAPWSDGELEVARLVAKRANGGETGENLIQLVEQYSSMLPNAYGYDFEMRSRVAIRAKALFDDPQFENADQGVADQPATFRLE